MSPEFTIHQLLRNSAEREPEQVAVVEGDASYTYEELVRCADALASALLEAGARKGDRVGIYMEKSWEAVVAMLAASQAGAIFVNINPLLKSAQVRYLIQDSDMKIMLGDLHALARLDSALLDVAFYKGEGPLPISTARGSINLVEAMQPGSSAAPRRAILEIDLATILYTSGSTGLPKGVILSQHNLVAGAQIVSTYLKNTRDDRILSVLPFSFDYGLNQLITSLRVGATLVLQRSKLPGDLARSLRIHRITGFAGVPPLWPLLLRSANSLEAQPLEDLRYITNSGGRIPQSHLDALRRCLPATDIYLMYGLTEAFRSTYLPPEELDRGSDCMGKPVPNTEIWVVDKSGRECSAGKPGELVHRGPTVALGYWGKEEETYRVFRPSPYAPTSLPVGERVVYSGDLVRRDEHGYLYFVGRDDQLIKTHGYRLSPEEVESLIVSTGIVREACVFGVPDGETGEQVVALVSLLDDAQDAVDSIREFLVRNAPPYMVPRDIVVMVELPKTSSGKLDRKAMRDAYLAR